MTRRRARTHDRVVRGNIGRVYGAKFRASCTRALERFGQSGFQSLADSPRRPRQTPGQSKSIFGSHVCLDDISRETVITFLVA